MFGMQFKAIFFSAGVKNSMRYSLNDFYGFKWNDIELTVLAIVSA